MILFLIGALGLKAVSSQLLELEEGDDCEPLGGGQGTCVLLTKCETIGDFRTNQPPICGFPDNSVIPIVCCPTKPTTRIKTGEKAEKFCKEMNDRCKVNQYSSALGLIGKAPRHSYMVLIGYGRYKKEWGCSGSLITKRYVLSAAHCSFLGSVGPAIWAKLGKLDISSSSYYAKTIVKIIIKRIPHPHYSADSFSHDIALFKLDSDVVFNEYISPICLNTKRQITSSWIAAMGWESTGPTYADMYKLLEVNMKIYNETECKIQADQEFCAATPPSMDTCLTYLSGPLVVLKPGKCIRTQLGIASHGFSCGLMNYPGVCTRISKFISWIEEVAFGDEIFF